MTCSAGDHGIRGFLVADTGLLEVLVELQRGGEIPASVVWKVSAMLAPANPLTVRQLGRLGASTINVPSDATLALHFFDPDTGQSLREAVPA